MIKVEMGTKAAPSTIFASTTDPSYGLLTYTGAVNCHFTLYGMDAISTSSKGFMGSCESVSATLLSSPLI